MDHFSYRNGHLYAEDVPVIDIASTVGTPCYIYSRNTIEQNWMAFDSAFGTHPHLICYAVKANSNLAVLNILARLGSGFDIVSVGELERVIAAGGSPSKVVFSGVGKRRDELERALEVGVYCFNVESESELAILEQVAMNLGKRAPISLRINPDVDANTHPYISTGLKKNKFGIEMEQAVPVYMAAIASPHLEIFGVAFHIGSQLMKIAPFISALERVLELVCQLERMGIQFRHIDLGGGLGIRYKDEKPPAPVEYISAIINPLRGRSCRILVEPGRAIVGNSGILVTSVELLKQGKVRNFAIVDTAMNDLLRPALYSAWQAIIPVELRHQGESHCYDIVGPICETSDFIGNDRELIVAPGDLLAICTAGAYGFSMSSNYNSRPRAAEIMVDGDRFQVIRQRETIASLYAGETLIN